MAYNLPLSKCLTPRGPYAKLPKLLNLPSTLGLKKLILEITLEGPTVGS